VQSGIIQARKSYRRVILKTQWGITIFPGSSISLFEERAITLPLA
jgi:hypothetical protein